MKSRPSIGLATLAMALTLFLSILGAGGGGQEPDANPAGTWKWDVANPDGQIPKIIFTLKLQGETLTGTITKSSGTTTITNGVFKGDNVSFQTIREGKAGKTTTTYRGKLSGDTIKGKVEINAGGKEFNSDWAAKRIKE